MILFVFLSTLVALSAVADGKQGGVSYSCPINQVLAVSSQSDKEIDLNAVQATICGEQRTCIYTQGATCVGKGQYVSSVNAGDGNLALGCCQYSPPVQDHEGDDCHEQLIETDGSTISQSGPRPPPFTGTKPSGAAASREEVVVQLKATGPGNVAQLVKHIKKIKINDAEGYSVNVCSPRCKGSSTTRQPTTQKPKSNEKQQQQQPAQPEKAPKKSLLGGLAGHHCFSGDMIVNTPFGTKRMDEVRAGDQVLVMASDSKPVYEPVEWLYHRDPNAEADFITVTTKSQRTLRLSANHLIPIVPCSNIELKKQGVTHLADAQSYFARRLRVGNCIAALIDNEFVADQVINIVQERKRGIYSPITNQGTIIVNDVYVSCYSSVENHLAQKNRAFDFDQSSSHGINSLEFGFRHDFGSRRFECTDATANAVENGPISCAFQCV